MTKDAEAVRDALELGNVDITIDLDEERMILHIHAETIREGLSCPICGERLPVYDTRARKWRHLDIGVCKTCIHYRQPRVKCPKCGTHSVLPPWAPKLKSHFTELFEQNVIYHARHAPVLHIAESLGESDKTIWRIIERRVGSAMEAKTLENADRIVLDETSSKKGRKYVTVFINARTHETMFATAGKGMDTLAEFSEHLSAHGGKPENIKEIAMDMSPSFIAGAKARFPAAELTFDKFHVIQMMSSAVDEVRRSESKINPILKGSRWIWLKNPSNLTAGQASELKTLSKENLKTAEAYRIKLTLQDIYRFIGKDARLARIAMEQWIDMAKKSGLKPVMDAAASLAAHIRGVVRHFSTGLTSGVAEGFNSIIQEIKRRARGYRNSANFISMIYLSTAGLDTI